MQRCIIHMLHNSFKYVSYKDIKKIASNFKAVYKAPTEETALSELEGVKEIWGKKYPYAFSSWEHYWDVVSPFFQFSDDIRRIMYTSNIIEGVNRQFRKTTKTNSSFPTEYYDVKVHSFREISAGLSGNTVRFIFKVL